MNFKMIGRFHSLIFAAVAIFMTPALVISITDGEPRSVWAFVSTIVLCAALSATLGYFCRCANKRFYAKEGLICVGVAWISICLVGSLPFFVSGEIPSFIDALFEIVSGFTTTGASVVTDVEAMSRGMLYWRSFSHWLGGMGVLVFLLAIIPVSGKNQGFTLHLMRAESPGPDVGKLVPKIRQTAAILYITYVSLTVLDFVLLLVGGMPVFDAVCTVFGTAGTGGFGIKADSMASYSPYLQNVTTIFMLLFGVNFSVYYLLLTRHFLSAMKDEELHLYGGIVLTAVVCITVNIRSLYTTFGETLRHAFFQVASIITTTGFATTDFNLWPTFSKTIIIVLMLCGACAGSTGGGFKCARVLLLIKGFFRNLRQVIHPQKIESVRINGKHVDEKILSNTNAYLFAYVAILLISFLFVSLDPYSETVTTAFTSVVSCFNNIGPGLDGVGPMASFAGFGWGSKLVLIFDMLAGRLEIFPILVLFSPRAWERT